MIRLQFSYTEDIGSAVIRYFGHGAGWSHVDAMLPDGSLLGSRNDTNIVDGKTYGPGVQIRPPGYKNFALIRQINLLAPPHMTADFYAFINAQIGKPYDKTAIWGFAAGRDWRTPDSWFCSELQTAALEKCGWFPWALASPENKIDPDDLYLAISAREQLA